MRDGSCSSFPISNFATSIIGIPFAQRLIVFQGILNTSVDITGSQVVTVTLYKSSLPRTLGTAFASMVLNSTTQTNYFTNVSSTFNARTDFLQVQVVVSGANLTAGCDIMISVSTY